MADTSKNMTVGSPVKLIILFSIPMLIGNVFQQAYNIADSVIVGQFLGAEALASIGATSSLTFFFFAICNGFGSGGGIIVSQSFGKGDINQVKNCIANTGYIMVILPFVIGTLAFICAPAFLRLLGTPEEIIHDAVVYTRLMSVGLFFVSIYNYVSSMMRALGDSTTPLFFLIFSCFLNVGLDVLLVFVFKMGIFGAGLATLISQFVSNILCLGYAVLFNPYFKLTKKDLAFNTKVIAQTVKLGLPLSLQFAMIAISCMALQRVVNNFGPLAVAAFTATGRIEQVIHQPYQTLAAALSTFSGQNYGAKKYDRVISGYHKTMIMMAIFTAVMVPIIQIFGAQITAVFVSDAEVISMGATALRITSIFYIMLGIIYVVRGVLNGLGDAFFALLNGVVEVIGRFTAPILLTMIPFIGVWGIWWSVGVVWSLAGITAWFRYLYKKRKLYSTTEISSTTEVKTEQN